MHSGCRYVGSTEALKLVQSLLLSCNASDFSNKGRANWPNAGLYFKCLMYKSFQLKNLNSNTGSSDILAKLLMGRRKKKKKSNDWFVKHFLSKFEHESPKRKV